MKEAVENRIDDRCSHSDCKDKGSYTLKASCSNCGWSGTAQFTKGHKPPYKLDCPQCECNTVSTAY